MPRPLLGDRADDAEFRSALSLNNHARQRVDRHFRFELFIIQELPSFTSD
jgi:hypothetical protein